jgi:hypothetical protein
MTTNGETTVDTVVTALSEDMLARCGSVFRELLTIYNATGDVAIGTKLLPASKLEEAFVEGSSVSTIMGGRTWKKDSAYLSVFLRAFADEGCHGVRYHENGRSSGFYLAKFGLPATATTKKTKASDLSPELVSAFQTYLDKRSDPKWSTTVTAILKDIRDSSGKKFDEGMDGKTYTELETSICAAVNDGLFGKKWKAWSTKIKVNPDWKEPVASVPTVAPSVAA